MCLLVLWATKQRTNIQMKITSVDLLMHSKLLAVNLLFESHSWTALYAHFDAAIVFSTAPCAQIYHNNVQNRTIDSLSAITKHLPSLWIENTMINTHGMWISLFYSIFFQRLVVVNLIGNMQMSNKSLKHLISVLGMGSYWMATIFKWLQVYMFHFVTSLLKMNK